MTQRFVPFEIEIKAPDAEHYAVEARFRGTKRENIVSANPPQLKPREIQQAGSWLERGFIDIEYAHDFGDRLFKNFFQGEVLDLLRQALQDVDQEGGLRLMLDLPMPGELDDVPWELLYDEEGGRGFLARSDSIALVRHFTDLPLPHKMPEEGPLRVLLVAASPRDKPAISHDRERNAILRSLGRTRLGFLENLRVAYQHVLHTRSFKGLGNRLRQRSLVECDTLTNATRVNLTHKLLEARSAGQGYHVIHFAGHGESDAEGSFLALENEAGGTDLISAEEFAELIDGPEVNLVILNACKSASAKGTIKSVAQWVLDRGVPAVMGMQVPVLDRAAVEFAREFYGLWAAGQPLESAMGYARRLISRERRTQASDWSIPVLYMGPEDGLTLEMKPAPLQMPRPLRLIRWSFATLVSVIGTVTLLLSVPDTATALRKQVPLLRCWYPAQMSELSKFNIVVTDIPVIDAEGRHINSGEGRLLADHIYDRISEVFEEIDITSEIRPPAETCPITGSDQERRDQAKKLADDIGANMVIFGVVQKSAPGADFKPEFYISYRGFDQADEVIGEHELGYPVALPGDLSKETLLNTRSGLGARTQALVKLTIGLAHYSQDSMEEAASYFQQANDQQGWPEAASGKEVIHLMWGNALARQASQTVLDVTEKRLSFEEWSAYLEGARQQYEDALAHNPEYPRAKVGLASVYYVLARGEPGIPNATIDLLLLDRAESLYGEALQTPAEAELMIPAKVHFGMGQIYLARAQEEQRQVGQTDDALNNMRLAQEQFEAMIAVYDSPLDEQLKSRVKDLASHSNANLAAIRLSQGDVCGAIPFIIEADLLASQYYQARYSAFLGQTYEMLGDTEGALQAYRQGRGEADISGDERSWATLNARISTLESQTPVATPITCPTPTPSPAP